MLVQFYSFAYSCSVFLTPSWTIRVWVYFRALYSVPLIHVTALRLTLHRHVQRMLSSLSF